MRRNFFAIAVAGVLLAFAAEASSALVYALTNDNRILTFESESPGQILSSHYLARPVYPGDEIVGIAFRPETGHLLALGAESRLYYVSTNNWAVNRIGYGFSTLLSGWKYGFSVNPVSDNVRIVTNLGQNLGVEPSFFLTLSIGPDVKLAPGEVNAGNNPFIHGLAYSNNFAGASSSQAYGLTDKGIVTLDPEGDGLVRRLSSSWLSEDFGIGGIAVRLGSKDEAYVAATHSNMGTSFYRANLANGELTPLGEIGFVGPGAFIRSIAVVPESASIAVLGLGALGVIRRRRK